MAFLCLLTLILSVHMVLKQRWEARDRERLAVLQNWERVFIFLEPNVTTIQGAYGERLRLVREGQQVKAEWRGKEWAGFLRTLDGHIPDKGDPFQKGDVAMSDYLLLRPVSQGTSKEERYVGRIDIIFTQQIHPGTPGGGYKLDPETTAVQLHMRLQDADLDPLPEWRGEAEGLKGSYHPPTADSASNRRRNRGWGRIFI